MAELGRVLSGTALLTPETAKVARSLLRRDTPATWLALWDGPEDAALWCRQAVAKAKALVRRRGGLAAGGDIDLGTVFEPAVLLNALRQEAARGGAGGIDAMFLDADWSGGGGSGGVVVTLG